jgi:predicted class III extradiol MEMO1 family dioxygenase
MRTKLLSVLILTLILLASCAQREQSNLSAEPDSLDSKTPGTLQSAEEPPPVIPPSVAGTFYPSDADTLRADLERYLKSANPPQVDGEIIAKQNPDGGKKLDAVVVVAFSHRGGLFPDVSVDYKGALETPLGKKAINEKIARAMMDSDPHISFSQSVYHGEHSGEVQIPFIQTILPNAPIVPVILGEPTLVNIQAVTKGLERIARGNHILVVGTTDLSHYNPYDVANSLDAETVKLMVEGDPQKMARYLTEHYAEWALFCLSCHMPRARGLRRCC